jgi:hypothetical protein
MYKALMASVALLSVAACGTLEQVSANPCEGNGGVERQVRSDVDAYTFKCADGSTVEWGALSYGG